MKIAIRMDNGRRLVILLPNFLLFSPPATFLTAKASDGKLTYSQSRTLLKALKHSKPVLNGEPLVHIDETDGESIIITL